LPEALSGQRIAACGGPIDLPTDLQAEWDAVTLAHANVLLAGTQCVTNSMIASLTPHLRKPVHRYRLHADSSLPLPTTGSLILSEIGALDLNQQLRIFQWLDRFHEGVPVQLVSTTSIPLYSLVESGAFHDGLFYRLNTIRFDLNAAGEAVLL
jgi:Sigma-54 interaction domain